MALRDKSGDPIAVLEITRNITDQKLAEKNNEEQLSKLKSAIMKILNNQLKKTVTYNSYKYYINHDEELRASTQRT